MRLLAVVTFALSSVVLIASCKGDKLCTPGSTQPCLCAGGVKGAQACSEDGARWETCACSGQAAPAQPGQSETTAPERSKAEQCNSLIAVLNKGVQTLESNSKGAGGIQELKAMAVAMDKVAADAGALKLTNAALKKYATDYQNMAKQVASAARDMAAAAEAKDANKINSSQAAMEKAVKQEDPLVDSINKFCQAP